MIEYIRGGENPIAIIVRARYRSEGIEFLTPTSYSQQLGYMSRPKGYIINPHIHNSVNKQIDFTNEVLFIRSGSLRVDFYEENRMYIGSKILLIGDVILLAFGGHGFEMLDDCEIFEVKQGPYSGERDKSRFDSVSKSSIIII